MSFSAAEYSLESNGFSYTLNPSFNIGSELYASASFDGELFQLQSNPIAFAEVAIEPSLFVFGNSDHNSLNANVDVDYTIYGELVADREPRPPQTYNTSLTGGCTNEYLQLLEVYHSSLSAPIRVVNDLRDYRLGNKTFQAMRYLLRLPDDKENQQPTAQITIDNVGRELTDWLDISNGGRGAKVRVMHVLRDQHNTPNPQIFYDITVRLDDVQVNTSQIVGQLGYKLLLQEASTKITFRPENSPGLY